MGEEKQILEECEGDARRNVRNKEKKQRGMEKEKSWR